MRSKGFACALGLAGLALLWGPVQTADATADWTFLVYMSADNDLEEFGIQDFLEMADVGSTGDVNIVVIFDRHPGFDSRFGDWTDTRRGRIGHNHVPDTSWGQSIGEANLGDPNTLVDFVEWGAQHYPASKYALVLWDHGDGWRRAGAERLLRTKSVCFDYTDFDDLSSRELREALEDIEASVGEMDLIGFDACLMGMVEVAYEVRAHGDIMVASERSEPASGWPYDDVLAELVAAPGMSAFEFGPVIVQRYFESYANTQPCAATELVYMNLVAEEVDDFAHVLRNHWDTDAAYCGVHAYNAMTAVSSAVYAEAHGDGWPGSHGLAIYFPDASSSIHQDYNTQTILLPGVTEWDEFLWDYHVGLANGWLGDARAATQSYECANGLHDHVDMYDFCCKVIDEVPQLQWVDFDHTGAETGTVDQPFNTLAEAVSAAGLGDTIAIQAGASSETPTITKRVTLRACHTNIVIGAP
jgi:phage tail protein X